jgi:hypothetical protein
VGAVNANKEKTMLHTDTLSHCETLDTAWDDGEDLRDLIQTTPLLYDIDGLPVGYDARQLFGLEGAYLGGRA